MTSDLVRPSDLVRRRRLWSLAVAWRLGKRPADVCFVCELVAGNPDYPHDVVYEDDDAIAFLGRWPPLWGLTLVCPRAHREQVTGDFTEDEYLRLQAVVRRVGEALRRTVPCERLYVMSLGSASGNRHVHWHLAPGTWRRCRPACRGSCSSAGPTRNCSSAGSTSRRRRCGTWPPTSAASSAAHRSERRLGMFDWSRHCCDRATA